MYSTGRLGTWAPRLTNAHLHRFTNIAGLASIATTFMEKDLGFWTAFLLPTCFFWVAILLLVLLRNRFGMLPLL